MRLYRFQQFKQVDHGEESARSARLPSVIPTREKSRKAVT